MSPLPLVSAVITTFNRPEFLKGAVESALRQSHGNLELIVVDDASDGAPDLGEGAGRVRLIRHERNLGICAARNTGIAAARGEFVAFLDDDDRWAPGHVAKALEVFQGHPDLGMVGTGWDYRDAATGSVVPHRSLRPAGYNGLKDVARYDWPAPSASLFRKECLDAVGGYDSALEHAWEDADVVLRIAAKSRCYFIPDRTVTCTLHHGNATRRVFSYKLGRLRLWRKFISQPAAGVPASLAKRGLAVAHLELARSHAARGKRDPALSHLLRALRSRPWAGYHSTAQDRGLLRVLDVLKPYALLLAVCLSRGALGSLTRAALRRRLQARR